MIINDFVISSKTNEFVKMAVSLQEKKYRTSYGLFLADGIKLTLECAQANLPVDYIVISEEKTGEYLDTIKSAFSSPLYNSTRAVIVTADVFGKISGEKSPQGVISLVKRLDFFRNVNIIYKEEFFLPKGERALALYSLRDPINLGAVIRSAAAFGVRHIILSSDCSDVYNPRTVRSAMGSMFKVKVSVVSDFAKFVRVAREVGRRVYAAELREGALPLNEVSLRRDDVFVIGNEGHGIAEEISSLCDSSVYIPISESVESLNASVASALFMWEQSKI